MRARLATTLAALAATLQPAVAAAQTGPACPGSNGRGVPMARLGEAQPHLILDANFPDPFLLKVGGTFHAYATGNQVGGGQMNVQRIASRNLTEWSAPAEALPAANLPAWADRNHPQVWAPEVLETKERYVLYFNARHKQLTRTEGPAEAPVVRQRHCLGVAVSERAEGPFVGLDAPLVCEEFADGVIDAGIFRDGDSLYLMYKEDGNCCGRGTAIWVQGLSADGLAPVGPKQLLVANNDSPGEEDDWEWRVVEAPTMVRRGRSYYLFYSGNFFGNRNYAVAYLTCASPRGPCKDPGENPILWSHKETALLGPGHQSILDDSGRSLVFFHGWNVDPDGREEPGVHKRCLYVTRMHWDTAGAGLPPRPRIVGGEPKVAP